MQMEFCPFYLRLAHRWAIASSGPGGGKDFYGTVHVRLRARDGRLGLGETAPSGRYAESVDTVQAFLRKIDASRLSFDDLPGSLSYLDSLSMKDHAGKTAVNLALLDGAARTVGKSVGEFLGVPFTEGRHVTSFTIGVASPELIREKVLAAERYPILKLKVGTPGDRETFAALRSVAPTKRVRVDANEGWRDREEALRQIEWLAADGHVEFVEQPLPFDAALADLAWLRERSPLPLFADEAYHSAHDLERVVGGYHGVNVKLVKTGGVTGARDALVAARRAGLQTMLGCMIESSLLISAAAQLADLTDYLDLDGNVLITNDPFVGVRNLNGALTFDGVADTAGLRCRAGQELVDGRGNSGNGRAGP